MGKWDSKCSVVRLLAFAALGEPVWAANGRFAVGNPLGAPTSLHIAHKAVALLAELGWAFVERLLQAHEPCMRKVRVEDANTPDHLEFVVNDFVVSGRDLMRGTPGMHDSRRRARARARASSLGRGAVEKHQDIWVIGFIAETCASDEL